MVGWRQLVYQAGYALGVAGHCEILPALGLKFLGKTPASLRETARAIRDRHDFHRLRQSMRQGFVLLQSENGLDLWRTSFGDYWAPAGESDEFCYFLAEQVADLYVGSRGVILDCGANVGLYSIHALRGGAERIVAFEPDPLNLECLRRNLATEPRGGDVTIVAKGVWDADAGLPMHAYEGHRGSSSFVPDCERSVMVGEALPLTTIDRVVDDLSLPRVDYIKMDIEGAERNALRGAKAVIRRFRPELAISLYHLADDPEVIQQIVREIVPDYSETILYNARLKTVMETSLGIFRPPS